MSTERDSYRQILKATSVFGGVQVFSIIISLIKSKVIAMFLGTEGMGVYSLLQNPVNLISQISGLGLNSSGIRDVAQHADDKIEFSKTVRTVQVWSRVCGVAGAALLFFMSPLISQWTFGSEDYSLDFRFLSLSVFLLAVGYENEIILKGKRRIVNVGKAGIFSASCSLLLSLPLYYFFRINAIVAILVITNLLTFLFNRHFARKEAVLPVKISARELFDRGKTMATLGSMMVLSSVIQTLTMYIVNLFIRIHGNISDVGLFQAGMQITNISIDLVFTAMAGDFYPRLAAICGDRKQTSLLVNQQVEVASLICSPILMGMILFCPLLIQIFLSAEFLPIRDFVCWLLLAASLRASWTIYYVMLAKGDTKSVFWLVILVNGLLLLFYPLGYHFGGLKGLGIGYLMMVVLYSLALCLLTRRKYLVSYSLKNFLLLLGSFFGCLVVLLCMQFVSGWPKYAINLLIWLSVTGYCGWMLNKRTGMLNWVKHRMGKYK